MDWKVIIALVVLVLPLTYCEMERQALDTEIKLECIKQKGQWNNSWGGSCDFGMK